MPHPNRIRTMSSYRIAELHKLRKQGVGVLGSESCIDAVKVALNPKSRARVHVSAPQLKYPALRCRAFADDDADADAGVYDAVAVFDGLYGEVVQKGRPFNAHKLLKRVNRNAELRIRTHGGGGGGGGNIHSHRHNAWTGWPATNKRGNEDRLCTYLNALADSVREALKRPQAPEDLVFSSEYVDSDSEEHQTSDSKPDLVVIPRWMKDKGNADWGDFRAVVSIRTSINDLAEEKDQIMEYARCCFAAQDNRRYILGLGFLHNNLAFYLFDRSGVLATPHYNVDDHPEKFLELAMGVLFMHDIQLGYDPSITVEDDLWSVQAGGKAYEILDCLYVDRTLQGRGTVCFKVQDEQKKVFVVKDAWVDRTRKKTEVDFLKELKGSGVKNVPTIVSDEILPLPCDATERDTTENIRKKLILEELNGKNRTEALTMFRGAELRDHYRIVQGPFGELLDDFDSLPELLSATLDILNVIEELDRIGVLHCDISINNIILVEDPSSRYRKGYLIDFDSAARKGSVQVKGKLVGTLLFMAVDMIQTKATRLSVHDAESMLYCLIYLSCTQGGPHAANRTDEFDYATSFLDRWYPAEELTAERLDGLATSKFLVMNSARRFRKEVLHTMHPYFKPLETCFMRMRRALFPGDDDVEDGPDHELTSMRSDVDVERLSGVVLGELKSIVSSTLEGLEGIEKARADHDTTKAALGDEGNVILDKKDHPEVQGVTSGEDAGAPSRDAALVTTTELSQPPSPQSNGTVSSLAQILGKRPREIIEEVIVGEVLSDKASNFPAKKRSLKS